MTDAPSGSRGPLDRLLDLMVYAPLGLAVRAREELPALAARGREKLTSEANLARVVGQLAVSQGRRQVERLLIRPSDRPATPPGAAATAPPGDAATADPTAERPGRAVPVRDLSADPEPPLPVVAPESLPEPSSQSAPEPLPDAAPAPADAPDAADLPIPGYDSLSASQVVQRLPGLTPEELEAVRSYEAAGRKRKTVLLRVAQLRAAS